MPLVAGWILIVVGLPIASRLHRLPSSRAAPPHQPLATIADLDTTKLEAMAPRLNLMLEGLIVVAFVAAILFLPTELNPARRRLPGVRQRATVRDADDYVRRVPTWCSRYSVLSTRKVGMVGTPSCKTSNDWKRTDY